MDLHPKIFTNNLLFIVIFFLLQIFKKGNVDPNFGFKEGEKHVMLRLMMKLKN